MKTEKKQYRLNRWYPTLPNDWKTEHDYVYYKEESLMVNKLLMTTHIINFKHLEYRDFWEEVKETLKSKGKRVMRYDAYSGELWYGTIISETANSYIVVPDDDIRPTVRWQKADCELPKERIEK